MEITWNVYDLLVLIKNVTAIVRQKDAYTKNAKYKERMTNGRHR